MDAVNIMQFVITICDHMVIVVITDYTGCNV